MTLLRHILVTRISVYKKMRATLELAGNGESEGTNSSLIGQGEPDGGVSCWKIHRSGWRRQWRGCM